MVARDYTIVRNERYEIVKMLVIIIIGVMVSGCAYFDWGGVWFGCPEGQLKKPAVIGMFGTVKVSSECKPIQWMKDNNYVVVCLDHPGMLCEKYHRGVIVGEDIS